jgi:hypothetical protein
VQISIQEFQRVLATFVEIVERHTSLEQLGTIIREPRECLG